MLQKSAMKAFATKLSKDEVGEELGTTVYTRDGGNCEEPKQ